MVCIDGMSDEFFAYLDKQMKDGIFCWTCDKCTSITKKMLGQMSQLSRRVGELEENEKLNKTKWEKNDQAMENVERRLEKMETSEKKGASASAVFDEFRERDNRLDNLVVHGLDEAAETIKGKDRAAADIEKAQELIDVIGVNISMEEAVKFSRRLGEKKDNGPRPLQLGFKKSEDKEKILDNASKLADKNEPWKSVSIGQDLTNMQREEEAKMREDAKKRNNEMTAEEKSKNGIFKVVGKRGKRRMIREKEESNGPTRDRRMSTRVAQQQ